MRDRSELLQELRTGLDTGAISRSDIQGLLSTPQAIPSEFSTTPQIDTSFEKLSAVDVMFYISGLVLFAAIISLVAQGWDSSNIAIKIGLSLGIGLSFWAVAYKLATSKRQSDITRGLLGSLTLTGSLLNIAGVSIIAYQITKGSTSPPYIAIAVSLAALACLHFIYDRYIKRDLILLMAIVMAVGIFPILMLQFLGQFELSADVYALLSLASTALLVSAARVVSGAHQYRTSIRTAFDGLGAFIALGSMYVVSFSNYGVVWMAVLIASVVGLFYLSIIRQDKRLLGTGAFFLVLAVITISFKYFSGFGVTTSLIIATFGLLGTAAAAASINRKYFKTPSESKSSVATMANNEERHDIAPSQMSGVQLREAEQTRSTLPIEKDQP